MLIIKYVGFYIKLQRLGFRAWVGVDVVLQGIDMV